MTQEHHLVSPTLPALPKSGPTNPFFRPARAFGDTSLFLHSLGDEITFARHVLPAPSSLPKNRPARTPSRPLYLEKTKTIFLGQKVDCPADLTLIIPVTPSFHANSPPACPALSRLSHAPNSRDTAHLENGKKKKGRKTYREQVSVAFAQLIFLCLCQEMHSAAQRRSSL